MGEEKRHQMMQNLFGDQSEEEEEEEVESERDATRQADYISDEGNGEVEIEDDGEGDIEGQGEVEVESEAEQQEDVDPGPGESEGERAQSSQEREVSDQRAETEGKEIESDDEEEDYGQKVVTSRRREVVDSESERSVENHYADNEDEEVDQARGQSRSPSEEEDPNQVSHPVAEIRDVFGDSEDDEAAEYTTQNNLDEELNRSPMEEDERDYERNIRPDEDALDESEEENFEQKLREKPVGPPLELELPLQRPPGQQDKMNVIKVSNIMGIEPEPFDPKKFVEKDMSETDESGSKKRLRLENNIVRWRRVRNPDGKISCESNARFVRWSDGSLQLLLGNEVLDILVQEAEHDQTHLFLRHDKGILQSQGRLLKKMKCMPSSLSSDSHRLLTALVDSRHKKVYKVKNCITDIDPEREKEEKEKAEGQTIRANELLHRKREKVTQKYAQKVDRGRQLSPGFLEEALDEDDEPDYYESRRSTRHRYEDDWEMEAQAEKRIMNAKRSQVHKDVPKKSSLAPVRSSQRPVDFSDSEREESEYESDGYEGGMSASRKRTEEPHDADEHDEEEEEANEASEEEHEEPRQRGKDSRGVSKRKEVESDEDSPPKKAATHRRMAMVYDSDDE